ncbi:MAG: Crp/Fnr family transcriptional regulator [Thermonemataceae bacterium]
MANLLPSKTDTWISPVKKISITIRSMDRLKAYILSKINLSKEELREILQAFEYKAYKKDQIVVQKGQYVTKYYYIAKGGVRFVTDTPSKEITAGLIFENNLITELEALKSGLPSQLKIVTIEESEIFSIEQPKMQELYKKIQKWETFGRLVIEEAFIIITKMIISFQEMDAEKRYLNLLQNSEAIQRVPLKQLSTYLGITPNTLSRIRRKIADSH